MKGKGKNFTWKDKRKEGRPPSPDPLFANIRISYSTKEMLDSEQEHGERYNDTLLRLLQGRTKMVSQLRKKVDALEKERLVEKTWQSYK
jgi:hypothetical protein